jgi:hypothetical protein
MDPYLLLLKEEISNITPAFLELMIIETYQYYTLYPQYIVPNALHPKTIYSSALFSG